VKDEKRGVGVNVRSFWSNPVWRGLRIISFTTVTITLVILVVYFSGASSWRFALEVAVLANLAVFVALMIRSLILRVKVGRSPKL
jgi:amino acid transporter